MCSKNGTRTIERGTFGYFVDRKENRLVVNPDTAPYVQLIFRWYLMGYMTGQIARRLNLVQAKTPFYYKAMEEGHSVPDTDQWRCDRVKTILRNRTYAGDTVYGKRRKIFYKNVDAYHAKQEDWVIHEDTHEAIISRAEFNRVQDMMDIVSKKKRDGWEKKKEIRERFPDHFPQKVCCMECGNTMLYNRYARGASGTGFDGAFYECKGNDIIEGCGQRIHEDYLRIIVMDQIRNIVSCACDKKKLLKKLQSGECSTGRMLSLRRKISDLSAELARKVEARESLYENLTEGVIDSDDYRMLKEHYLLEEQKLKGEIEAAEEKKRDINRMVSRCTELVEHLEEYLGRQELDETMAAEFVEKIVISSAGKIEVRFAFNDVFAELQGLAADAV